MVVTQHTHYLSILKLVFLLNWLLCLANEQVGWWRKSGPTRRFKRSSKSRLYTCSTKTLMNSLVERIKLVQKNAQTVHCSEFFVKIKRSTSNTKKQIRYHQITFEKVHVQKLNLFAPEKGRFSAPKRNWSHLRYNHHFSVCVNSLFVFLEWGDHSFFHQINGDCNSACSIIWSTSSVKIFKILQGPCSNYIQLQYNVVFAWG